MQPIEKKVSRTTAAIDGFFSKHHYQVTSTHEIINNSVAKTTWTPEGLHFEFAKMILSSQKDVRKLLDNDDADIQFQDFNRTLVFKVSSASKFTVNVSMSGYTHVSGFIKEFKTLNLEENEKVYFRAVLITKDPFSLSSFFDFEPNLKIEDTVYGAGLVEITLNEVRIDLFNYDDKISKRQYFVIETRTKCSYDDLISILDEIVLALTYLTGHFIGREFYIVAASDETFERENIIVGLKNFFEDLDSGFAAVPDLRVQHMTNGQIKRFQLVYLEKLILKLSSSLIYKRAILLLCQAHSEPHYVKSTLYSVALETITNLISEEISEKLKPIQDKTLAKAIRDKLKDTMQGFKDDLAPEIFKKIESDIDRINSPTNKQKLLAPFLYYEYDLPQKDIEAIEKRNDFLHGRIPEGTDKHYLALINARLLFCINFLILKHIGFCGYIMYHPSMYQINNKMEIEEWPFRKI